MNKLLTAKDIAERYGRSEKTAMRYMRQMEHMEKPLRVTEQAVEAWEISRTYEPQRKTQERTGKIIRIMPEPGQKYIIPRVRPGRMQKAR